MRTGEILLTLGLVAVLPVTAQSPPPPALPRPVPAGPTVSLSDLSAPEVLEGRLRELLDARGDVRLTVVDGLARFGPYGVGTGDTLRGHLVVLSGPADVFGHVTGSVVTVDGDQTVHPGGSVGGTAIAFGGTVRDAAGGVGGEQRAYTPTRGAEPAGATVGFLTRAAGVLGIFLALLVLGFTLVTFGRPPLEIVSDTVTHSLGRAFLVGVLAQVLVVPTFGMIVVGLALTVVGVLLIPFAVAAFALMVLAMVLMGLVAVAHAMGESRTRRRMAMGVALSPNSYRYVLTGLAGLLAIWLVWLGFGWVPVAGSLVLTAAILATWLMTTVGFGASVLSRLGLRPHFAGRIVPPEALTDEYLWATPQFGVPAVKRPDRPDPR